MNTSVRSTGCNSLFIWINGFTNSLLSKAIDVLERKTSVWNLFFSTDACWPAALLKRDFGTAVFQSVSRNPQNTPGWRFPVLMQRTAYNAVTLHYQKPKNEVFIGLKHGILYLVGENKRLLGESTKRETFSSSGKENE